ncbi:MAG: LEVG family PEP-CTERM protein [Scytonema sp. PMC 1069.18]|nr:LEVG family PEP-CTERM protein [Scytonema sp. PMC 1069.18]MEC4883392.1 LEVG family PEP-CTERM protein [Scytonema sp. PMC 1070.18]
MKLRTAVITSFITGISLIAGTFKAQAMSLVPQTEGEIQLTNVSCLGGSITCIDTTSLGYTVTTQPFDFDNKGLQLGTSRLFVDKPTTANNWGFGITFKVPDAGTNPIEEYVFRPVAYLANNPEAAPTGTPAENGQLEIGRYLFDFLGKTYSEVEIKFYDVEALTSGIIKVNDIDVNDLLSPGLNNNVQTLTLKNVSNFVIQLGTTDSAIKPGDGVSFDVSVPEPTSVLGLAAVAATAVVGMRKSRKLANKGVGV